MDSCPPNNSLRSNAKLATSRPSQENTIIEEVRVNKAKHSNTYSNSKTWITDIRVGVGDVWVYANVGSSFIGTEAPRDQEYRLSGKIPPGRTRRPARSTLLTRISPSTTTAGV